jgi:hypothetical protein
MFSANTRSGRVLAQAIPPTHAIQDSQARAWCEAMASAWELRNGGQPESADRFVTRGEVGGLSSAAVLQLLTGAASVGTVAGQGPAPAEHQAVLDAVVQIVTNSKLYQLLRTPVQQIAPPRQRINQVIGELDDILATIDELTAGLAATDAAVTSEISARISADESLASLITTVAATADGAVALVASEATARIAGDNALASSLSIVATNASNALSFVSTETTARINGDNALASSISTVSTNVGTALGLISSETSARTSADAAITSALGVQVSRIDAAEAAITTESTTRSNKDNSLAQAINTIWASIGGAAALIQDGALAAVSPAAVTATKWLQVQAAVTDPNTGAVNTASIKQELLTYASAVDGTLDATWAIRANVNGYISGVGLMTTSGAGSAGGSTTSHFMVMADRFSLVSPTDTTLRPVAFSVDSLGNAVFAGLMSADGLYAGSIRGINVTASSHITKGSYLTSAAAAAATTLNVKNTADFPSSGSGWIIDSTNDRDAISWTGKTSTTLTGCSGVLAHNNGATIIPASDGMVIDAATNQMRYFGNRGDGTVEEMVAIGSAPGGLTGSPVLSAGNTSSGTSRDGAAFRSNSGTGLRATSVSSSAAVLQTTGGSADAVVGLAGGSGAGIFGASTGGGWGGAFTGNATKAALFLQNNGTAYPSNRTAGQISIGSRTYELEFSSFTIAVPVYSDGTNWRYFADDSIAA